MKAGISSSDLGFQAYRLLEQYNKMDLFLHANVATYEARASLQQRSSFWILKDNRYPLASQGIGVLASRP